MNTVAAPKSLRELEEAVRSAPRLMAVGNGTKPRLSKRDFPRLSTAQLRGIVEYEPDEFTFTALAGSQVRDISATLAERGQYLPFDPMLYEQGATLGGTVAAGISGPGRLRYGGLRDFILGVRFVDGMGRLLRLGGKVVKNAAGFDVPKFLVGSLGCFGVLGEITFKVFPRPVSTLTLRLHAESFNVAAQVMAGAAAGRWEFEALEVPADGETNVLARLAGPERAIQELAKEVLNRWPGKILPVPEAAALWSEIASFKWANRDSLLVKVPVSLASAKVLNESVLVLEGARLHLSGGGNVAFVSVPARFQQPFAAELCRLGLQGLAIRGDGPLWLGNRRRSQIEQAVKGALDPENRFPSLDD